MEKKVNFKIQNLVLRSDSLPDEHYAMMYRGSRLRYYPMQSAFKLLKGEFTEFFTYFNSFSYAKWKKYTCVDNVYLKLKCKGQFTVQMFGHYLEGRDIKKEFYPIQHYNLKSYAEVEIPIPQNISGQVIGFQIAALSEFWIEGGGWYTEVPQSKINNVRISIATTTFKKEEYIKRNIDILERELFYSDEPCKEHFRLRVVDNGRSLDPEEFNSEYITVFPNDNVGGAGGFCRGMIESRNGAENPTHILLMDDDVIILPEALIRTYSLLALMKEQYKKHFISGAMLKAEQMNEQHEDVGFVSDKGYYMAEKPTMFLHLWDHVFLNEEEHTHIPNSYAAWWYCCFPANTINEEDLPLPVFIRCDDVDFSVRHQAQIITLNGIFVWHNDFKYKFSAAMEFYMVNRNSLITKAIDGIYSNADFIGHINQVFDERICSLDYKGCDLLLDAIEDYLKGPDFLKVPRGEQIVKEKSAKNEKLVPLQQACLSLEGSYWVDRYRVYDGLYNPAELKGFKKFLYKATKNGHIMPKSFLRKETAVIPNDWFYSAGKQYMSEQVLAVSVNGTANLRIRSRKRFLQLVNRRKKLMKRYKRENKKITQMYSEAAKTFRSEVFWKEYLGI